MSAQFDFAIQQPFQEQDEVEQHHETANDIETLLSTRSTTSNMRSSKPRIKYSVAQLLALSKSPLSQRKPKLGPTFPEEILPVDDSAHRKITSPTRGRYRGRLKRYVPGERPIHEDESEEHYEPHHSTHRGRRGAKWFAEPVSHHQSLDPAANLTEEEQSRKKAFEEFRQKMKSEKPQEAPPAQIEQQKQPQPQSSFFDLPSLAELEDSFHGEDIFAKFSKKSATESPSKGPRFSKFFSHTSEPTEPAEMDFQTDKVIADFLDVDDTFTSEESILKSLNSSNNASQPSETSTSASNPILDLLNASRTGETLEANKSGASEREAITDASNFEAELLKSLSSGKSNPEPVDAGSFNAQAFFKNFETQQPLNNTTDPLISALQQQQQPIHNPLEILSQYGSQFPYQGYQQPQGDYVNQFKEYLFHQQQNAMRNQFGPVAYTEQQLLQEQLAQPQSSQKPTQQPAQQPPQQLAKKAKQKKSLIPTQMLMHHGKTYSDIKSNKTKTTPSKKETIQPQQVPSTNVAPMPPHFDQHFYFNPASLEAIPSIEEIEQNFVQQ